MSRHNRNKQPKVLLDIIIPVFNRFDILQECLDAIPDAASDLEYQVIISDNGSTEEPDKFYNQYDFVKTIRNGKNLGFPRACNVATRGSKSPLILFLNSDVVLNPGSLNSLVREMDNPKTGVAGMKLLFPEYARDLQQNEFVRPPNMIQHVGIEISIKTMPIHMYLGWSEDNPRIKKEKDVFAVTGAALITRRNIWKRIGGFDESFGLGTFEDVSYCVETRKLGYDVVVDWNATGVHYTGATAEKYRMQYPMQVNHLHFVNKHRQDLLWTEWRKW